MHALRTPDERFPHPPDYLGVPLMRAIDDVCMLSGDRP